MAEVYVEELILENFGPFYGEHVFDFSQYDGKTGVLVGGKNGTGKTHLLRALYLAVVGDRGVGDLKRMEHGSDATRFVFDRSLNRRAKSEGADTIRLAVTVLNRDPLSQVQRTLKLLRKIRFRQNSAPVWSSTAVRSDEGGEIDDDEVITRLRDTFLPRHLAQFFFFDAERSQNVNLGQKDIVEGIGRILGLRTYSELESDLRQLIQNNRKKGNASSGQNPIQKLADINANVMQSEGHLSAQKQELDTLRRDATELEAELSEVEESLQALGAVDPQELEEARSRRTELGQAKSDVESSIQDAWEAAIPLTLLGAYRRSLYDYLLSEEARRQWESAKNAVEPKIPQVKADVFEDVPEQFTLALETMNFYESRLVTALHKIFHPPPEGMSQDIIAADQTETSVQVRKLLERPSGDIEALAENCLRIERLDTEIRELDHRLRQMQPNSDAHIRGQELHEKRGKLGEQLAQNTRKIQEVKDKISTLENNIIELKREETLQNQEVNKFQRWQSLATLAAKYREAASEIRAQAADWMRQEMSRSVGNLWIEIAERSREFSEMKFDQLWECWLHRIDGVKVKWDDINASAGQRQVRMLAFYESLRRLAKLVPPLVIDTPLARLDNEVREMVLKKLYLSGHQSILLATNSEIDPNGHLFTIVRNNASRVYTLHPHGAPDTADYEVRVTRDYFGR